MIVWKRTLRTRSSERFLATRDGKDVAAVDLHFLDDGSTAGTVIVLRGAGIGEADIPELLRQLDDDFLPHVDLERGNLTFTVVVGDVVANYEPEVEGGTAAPRA